MKNADAAGIQECIAESFQRIGITKFSEKMVGLNVDGASVNMGKFTGLGTRLEVEAPWLSTWPLKDGINFFGETAINDLSDCFEDLLKKNGCDVDALNPEWMTLKTYMVPLIKNKKEHYIDIWQHVMKSELVVNDCSNILHIIEILLCTPFSNAKLEKMFSRMARVKTDYSNRLGRTLLDACLHVSENSVELSCFDPDPAIDQWFAEKVRRISSSSHNYPSKRKSVANKSGESTSVVDIATISDLENSDEEFTGFESCFD